jgi:acyl carrier protein
MSNQEQRYLFTNTILAEIRQQLIELETEVKPNPDWRLEEAGLDSFGLLSLVVSLEQRYDIQFSSDELQELNQKTLGDIAEIIADIITRK